MSEDLSRASEKVKNKSEEIDPEFRPLWQANQDALAAFKAGTGTEDAYKAAREACRQFWRKRNGAPKPAPEKSAATRRIERHKVSGEPVDDDRLKAKKAVADLKKGDTDGAGKLAHVLGMCKFTATEIEALLKELAKTSGLSLKSLRANYQAGVNAFKEANPDLDLEAPKEMPEEVKAIAERWSVIKLKGEIVAAEMPLRPSEQPNLMPFHMFMHDRLAVPVVVKKEAKAGQLWHDNPEWRTDYDGYQFAPPGAPPLAPGVYNGFSGWPDPQAGAPESDLIDTHKMTMLELGRGCSRYLWHVRHVICSGDRKLYRWVLTFIADMLKNPGLRVRVALCLRGGEGIGKSIMLALLQPYLGGYMWETKSTAELVGRFNPEFTNLIALISNEAHHDAASSKALRDMVTRESWRIEQKFVSAITVNKYARLFFNANAGTVVDTPEDDRRFTIADVSERMKGNQAYFDALLDQMRGPESCPHNRGLACFVELVTKRWNFDRDVLKKTVWTEAHASHVRENLNPLQRFIIAGAMRGRFVDPKGQIPHVVHLEGDSAKTAVHDILKNDGKTLVDQEKWIAIPYGPVEDLFRVAYPDKFVQRDHGTPDAIREAFIDLVGAEPKLRQLRVDGERAWCIITPPLAEWMATLDRRNLLPKRDDGTLEDAGAGHTESDDPLFGWKALPAFSKHPGAMTDTVQAFGTFLRDPGDVWAQAALAANVTTLADCHEPAPNVVAIRRAKR